MTIERQPRYWFDISTLSRWQGAAVGIIRVERELAVRARHELGRNLAFCVYDLGTDRFRAVDNELASSIIAGHASIEYRLLGQKVMDRVSSSESRLRLRRHVRRQLRRSATVYRIFQRLRGRNFTRLEIQALRDAEFNSCVTVPTGPGVLRNSVSAWTIWDLEVLDMGPNDTIISGGLDWDHKRIRRIGALKQNGGFKYVAVLYDLIPLRFPHYVVPSYVDLLRDYFGELFWIADHLMCISNATQRDFLDHCEMFAIPPPRSDVFPLGSDLRNGIGDRSAPVAQPESLVGKVFALFVSTIEPRKNHRVLYEAWDQAMLEGRLDPERHRLVFVGRIGWAVGDLIHEVRNNSRTKDTILIMDHVGDEMLQVLYQLCTVTLFPSHYEGYGLPVAESLAYGKPCIASSSGSLGEIGGDLVRRVAPRDIFQWSRAIVEALTHEAPMSEWQKRIVSSHVVVTWDKAAAVFFRAIKTRLQT